MQTVYLLCGVSGVGKTWICEQVKDHFEWIPQDDHFDDQVDVTLRAAKSGVKPVLTECPFGERITREQLERKGAKVIPVFVVEDPKIVARRYESREGKPLPKNAMTRASTIIERVREWRAFSGTANEVLHHLKGLSHG